MNRKIYTLYNTKFCTGIQEQKKAKGTGTQLLYFVAQTSVLIVAFLLVLLLWAHKTRFGNIKAEYLSPLRDKATVLLSSEM